MKRSEGFRVLLLEDSPADAELIVSHLGLHGFAVRPLRVDSKDEFRGALRSFRPDLILFDQGVPGLSTLEAISLVKEEKPAIPVIIVTGARDTGKAIAAFRAGADELIDKAALGELGPAVERALALRVALRTLTPRQVQVLRMIVTGSRSSQIADELGLSIKTIESHRTSLMRRLDIHDVSGLVRFAVRVRLVQTNGL